ncbi:unnamed protein product [Calicophoron daubneyi]|uniref:RAD50-interacting protein 1 n=1 Tax=Calicophoron daubneyi TaxID=300641 RepID=A0AAV2TK01_CALDB
MKQADDYAKQINDLLRSPGRTDKKLLKAISTYEEKILDLKQKILLEDGSNLTELYDSAMKLKNRISNLLNSCDTLNHRLTQVTPIASDLLKTAQPYLNKCEESMKKLKLYQLKEFIRYYDSSIDAARLLRDDQLLIEAMKQYSEFVNQVVTRDPESLDTILKEREENENFLAVLSKLAKKFEALLEGMHFPILPSIYLEKLDSESWDDEQLSSFAQSFKRLASLDPLHINVLLAHPLSDVVCLPMQIILKILEKRFCYHFWGNKKTNRVDKPEWFMTQVLQWIRDNDYVLTIVDRDFLSKDGTTYNLRVEFMRGLVLLLIDKLQADLGLSTPKVPRYALEFSLRTSKEQLTAVSGHAVDQSRIDALLSNVEYFGHLVDVILQTDARLTQLAYPADEPRPSDVLSLPEVFSRWLVLENRLATDRLNILLTSPTAWISVDEEQPRPQCADDFVALLQAVGLRGRQLGDKIARTRFLRVQLSLIKAFHDRLVKISQSVMEAPVGSESDVKHERADAGASGGGLTRLFSALSSSYSTRSNKQSNLCLGTAPRVLDWLSENSNRAQSSRWIAVLNAFQHISQTLLELANDQYYVSFWEDSTIRALLRVSDPWMADLGLEDSVVDSGSSDSTDAYSNETLANVGPDGGVFNGAVKLIQERIATMLNETVRIVMDKIRSKSAEYISSRDYWLRASSVSGITGGVNVGSAGLELSGAASVMLITLRDWLFSLSKSIHPKLFSRAWLGIARSMDEFLYKKLILCNRFTPEGAAQLRFDLTHCLYPLFALYTERPEAHFAQTRDACILLNLLRGSAELLRSTLKTSMSSVREDNNPLGPLLELGVYSLTPEEAIVVLSLRATSD